MGSVKRRLNALMLHPLTLTVDVECVISIVVSLSDKMFGNEIELCLHGIVVHAMHAIRAKPATIDNPMDKTMLK